MVITNYPEDKEEYFELPNIPKNEEAGVRKVPFTRELYIDADDFAEVPPPKFFRMKPDGEVRLMGAYIVKCNEVVKDEQGNVVELHCTADLETGNGNPVDGRKVKGTIHWVSAKYAIDATVRLYDYLFTLENVNDVPEGTNYLDYLNPNSLTELHNCKLEPSLAEAKTGDKFQIVGAFRNVVDVFQGEQVVVQAHGGVDGIFGRYPVDGALDLAAVNRVAVAGLEVGGACSSTTLPCSSLTTSLHLTM